MTFDCFGTLAARPPDAGDEVFLAQLYASTRADLMQLPVPAEVGRAIIAHQQTMQAAGYARDYPDAQYCVLEHEGVAVGRIVLNMAPGEIRVVDLAIAEEARRHGHARVVLSALQERAVREGRALALRVRSDNTAARALYGSLGFKVMSSDEFAEQMRWPG